jgi:hypothetical protein
MIAANDNRPAIAYASNGVSLPRFSFTELRPAPVVEQDDIEPDVVGNVPLEDAFGRGYFSDGQRLAVGWWIEQQTACEVSFGEGSLATAGGGRQSFISRPREALFAQEVAADRSMALGRVYKLLRLQSPNYRSRGLADVIDAAVFMQAAMSDLAPPRLVFPVKKRAIAGRIRLGAGLENVARFIGPGCTMPEAREIAEAAADACMALVAVRALRPANDNLPAVRRAAA